MTTGVTTITIPQKKLICNPVLKRYIKNFKGENLKNHLTKWKNVTSDKIIVDVIENGLKLNLIDTPKSNSKFAFLLARRRNL